MARLGELAVERGYITTQQLGECLREQEASGGSLPLGQILLRRRYLTPERFVELLGEHNRYLLVCPECDKKYQILGFKGQALWCLVCGRELILARAPEDLLHDDSLQTAYRISREEGRPGLWIGRYQILREIARGGMGVVFEAIDPALGRKIALKILKEGEADLESVKRLHREAALAGKLKHPRIVMVHEVGVADGTHYIAMDYIEGITLAQQIAKGTLPIREAAQIVKAVAEAIAYAHTERVIHRDLKPSNVILDPNRGPIVTDFGLAKELVGASILTAAGALVGTPQYMAPEQIEGNEPGPAVDVYALGVILYETLVGKRPFEGSTLMELQKKVVKEEPVRPRAVRDSIGVDLETIALKCLEKEPGRRYANAHELAQDLRRWLDGEAIQAHPPSMLYRMKKIVWQRRGMMAVAGITLGVATVGWLIVGSILRSHQFKRMEVEARQAFAARQWVEAKGACERGLEIRRDDRLQKMLGECRKRITEEEGAKRRKIAEGEQYRRLQERIKPVEAIIQETRPFFYIESVDIRAKLGKVEKALEELEKIARDPEYEKYPEVWAVLGMGWYFVGDGMRAEEALLKADALAPEEGRVRYYLGRIYLERSMMARLARLTPEMTGAEQAYGEKKERSKEWNAKAQHYMQRLTAGLGEADGIDRPVAEAYKAFAEGDEERVLDLCREGLERFARDVGSEEFWNLVAWIKGAKDPMEQIAAYTRAIERRPHYAWGRFMRGVVKQRLEDPMGALEDYNKAIHVNPRCAEAYHNRAAIRYAMGDGEGTLADFNEIIRINPQFAEAYNNRGNVRDAKGDVDGAMADYEEAIRIDPSYAEARANRGNICARKGDLEGALADYDESIRLNPSYANAYANRGVIRVMRKELDRALADFDEALRQDPRNVETYVQRGNAWTVKGDLQKGIADYEKALELAPPEWPLRSQMEDFLKRNR